MKLCKAWPEYCVAKSKVDESPEPETEFFPKDYVESKVRESLQVSINKAIKDVVEDDPIEIGHKSVQSETARPVQHMQVPVANAVVPEVKQSTIRDIWICFSFFGIVFLLLFSFLYSRICILEKVIFESR
jgi:hypothetical protein